MIVRSWIDQWSTTEPATVTTWFQIPVIVGSCCEYEPLTLVLTQYKSKPHYEVDRWHWLRHGASSQVVAGKNDYLTRQLHRQLLQNGEDVMEENIENRKLCRVGIGSFTRCSSLNNVSCVSLYIGTADVSTRKLFQEEYRVSFITRV